MENTTIIKIAIATGLVAVLIFFRPKGKTAERMSREALLASIFCSGFTCALSVTNLIFKLMNL